ncbi:thioredoxin family protein [Ferruginibacter lapsinanis]|uniref:thioredoxin family protein n=1 Tax=Ferruginibacter lapsinanis TaxID=563172 RepID=UPI001E5F6A1E|nr:thioredoxin family protein [Ferruginibacter lapsinanis]UEG50403.1 thioredoxin family protein [Ferruginibacter lapsinanis]
MRLTKVACFIALILTYPFFVNGQVKFKNLQYQAALQKAAKDGKLLFVFVPTPDCVVCKDITLKNFSDAALSDKIAKDFIAITLSTKDISYTTLTDHFDRANTGGILFIGPKGNVLHQLAYNSSTSKEYIKACDKAISNKAGMDSLEVLTKEYNAGNTDITFLETYINKRIDLGLDIDDLLDEYATLVPKDSLMSSYRINSFIMEHVSIYGSSADDAWHTSKSMYKEVWYRTDRKVRSAVNKRVRIKSMAKAVKEKNDNYALRVIRAFTEGNSIKKSKTAQKNYSLYCADYYWAVRDTQSYIYNAKIYIDQYINNVLLDSIRAWDKRQIEKTTANVDSLNDSVEVPTQTFAKFYASTLNQHAWNFYKAAKKSTDLRNASYWSLKSLELEENEGLYWDTYARLLYVLGDKIKAIDAEKKAIDLVTKKGYSYTAEDFKKVLKNMQSNKTTID